MGSRLALILKFSVAFPLFLNRHGEPNICQRFLCGNTHKNTKVVCVPAHNGNRFIYVCDITQTIKPQITKGLVLAVSNLKDFE